MPARRQIRARGGARNKSIIAAEMAVQDILEKWSRAPFQSGERVSVPVVDNSVTTGEWARRVFPTTFQGL
jgi:hypothetical protein